MADTTAVPVEMDLVALLVEVLVLITIVHLDHLLKKKEAGVVILETTRLMEDEMIGTTTMDHLETALVEEAGVVILETTPLMVDAMIGTTIMDHLETALAMEDLTDFLKVRMFQF